jgi:glycosyltransferase involved in cell wall biosynthesis
MKLIRITTVPVSLKVLLRNQLRYMSAYFDILAVSSPNKELEEVGRQEGVNIAPVKMNRSITPLRDMRSLWQLYRLFKKEQPDIVHTHTPKAGLLGMAAAWMAKVPVRMHTVAGLPLVEATGIKKKVLELTERLTYRFATSVYPNSYNLAAYISNRRFCKTGKLKVLANGSSNGIDMDYFQLTPDLALTAGQLRKGLQINENCFVFVFIGRLVKDKGIEELVAAFSQLKSSYSHIKLLLVGPFEHKLDPLSKKVLRTIQEDAAIIHVDFQQDVRPWLAISHVLVFPTYREGFPNVPMQAGCLHIPAIVTDINGCNEIIKHGENGLIVPVKQTEALYMAMKMLLTNRPLYLTLKAQARQLIGERFEQKNFWKALLTEYHEQLKSRALVSQGY